MKTLTTRLFFVLLTMFLLSSCSTNQFATKKNHHPRVRVEASNTAPTVETATVENVLIPLKKNDPVRKLETMKVDKVVHDPKVKETFSAKMIKAFFPKKYEVLKPIFKDKKGGLRKGQETKMDGDQVTGLVINLLALALAITAIFMILGMGSGNVWVYFCIGMILAVCALIIGFIGKKLPWRGFAIAAVAVAILAIVLLIVFLVAVTVFSLIW